MTYTDEAHCDCAVPAMTRKPPLWLKRDPMTRTAVIEQLTAWADGNTRLANNTADPDIKAGLLEQAITQAAVASLLREPRPIAPRVLDRLEQLRDARLGCARATTETNARATYVDAWHTYSEALRFIKAGQ